MIAASRLLSILGLLFLASLSAAAPATRPSARDRERELQLSRQAADLIDQHKFSNAEPLLRDALALVPDNTTCLYNMACVRAAQGDGQGAMDWLERATDAGFTDFRHLERDPLLRPVRELPAYQQLLARKDEITRRAAEQIVTTLKEELGTGYQFDVDGQQKLIFAVHADRAGLTKVETAIRAEAASQWKQVFSHKSDEFIRVIVASPVDFAKREHREGVQGRYDDSTRTLLVRRIGPELRHEFTHALHAADQRALDQEHPVWLSEGLASLYENALIEPKSDGTQSYIPNDTWRLAAVQAASRHRELIPLSQLLMLDRNAFTARATLAYGESGSLLLYLYHQDLLKRFYDAYTQGYAKDSTGRLALESVTGRSLSELQEDWEKWMRRRASPKKS